MSVDLQKHELIKCRLRLAGISLSVVANKLGVSPSTVTLVSQGYRKSHRIQKAIATEIDETVENLFPERYTLLEKNEEDEPMPP